MRYGSGTLGVTISSDASASFENPKSGWRVRVVGTVWAKPWTDVTRRAFGEGSISIIPLELLVAARLALAVITSVQIPNGFNTMVIRVDNSSVCACINMGRALSKTMRRAIRILVNIQETYMCRVVAQHLRTDHNKVAYWLSRGHYVKLGVYLSKSGGMIWGRRMDSWTYGRSTSWRRKRKKN